MLYNVDRETGGKPIYQALWTGRPGPARSGSALEGGGTMAVEIAVIGPQRPFVLETLTKEYHVHNVIEAPDKIAALRPVADRLRAVVTNAMTGLSAEMIDILPNLELCAIMGVGLETTNLERARERGIVVTTTPVLYDDVADLAVILGMCAARRIAAADRFVRSGQWLKGRIAPAQKFSGKRAGILGLGRIGTALAPRLQAFGMTIGFYDPQPKPGVPYQAYDSPLELAKNSDILFLAAAGGPGIRQIVDAGIIEALGPKGIFVNVARGWLVDEAALVEALTTGRLGAAGLDVFEHEPQVPDELLGLDNVVLTPHIASNTEETMRAMGECVLENVRSWFAGNAPVSPVA
jgi:hydroxypyruvate reductase